MSCHYLLLCSLLLLAQAMEAKKEESWKQKLPTKSKEYRNGGKLRDYQIEGALLCEVCVPRAVRWNNVC